jgi:hypothetical protein
MVDWWERVCSQAWQEEVLWCGGPASWSRVSTNWAEPCGKGRSSCNREGVVRDLERVSTGFLAELTVPFSWVNHSVRVRFTPDLRLDTELESLLPILSCWPWKSLYDRTHSVRGVSLAKVQDVAKKLQSIRNCQVLSRSALPGVLQPSYSTVYKGKWSGLQKELNSEKIEGVKQRAKGGWANCEGFTIQPYTESSEKWRNGLIRIPTSITGVYLNIDKLRDVNDNFQYL